PKMPERQLTGHTAAVGAVALSADGSTVVSGGDDHFLRVWDRSKGTQTRLIGAHAGSITSVAFHPANAQQLLSASAVRSLKLWQLPAARSRLLTHAGQVTSAALSADGKKLLTGCADKQVRLWDPGTGAVEKTFTGPTLTVLSVALSPKADRAAAGSADKTLHVWDAGSGKELKKLTLD